jgi:hypothetical protein
VEANTKRRTRQRATAAAVARFALYGQPKETDVSDEELVAGFEAATLGDGQFPHAAHVRVGWWYLCHHPLPEALMRFSDGLRRFAAAKGVPGRYHETITVAYMLLMAERLHGCRELSWAAFADHNADLLAWPPSILTRYYTDETLASERARCGFVMPDRVKGSAEGASELNGARAAASR